MPIFDYVCEQCGREIEVFTQKAEGLIVQCRCQGEPVMKRKIPAPAVHYHGKGFHSTDYRSK